MFIVSQVWQDTLIACSIRFAYWYDAGYIRNRIWVREISTETTYCIGNVSDTLHDTVRSQHNTCVRYDMMCVSCNYARIHVNTKWAHTSPSTQIFFFHHHSLQSKKHRMANKFLLTTNFTPTFHFATAHLLLGLRKMIFRQMLLIKLSHSLSNIDISLCH